MASARANNDSIKAAKNGANFWDRDMYNSGQQRPEHYVKTDSIFESDNDTSLEYEGGNLEEQLDAAFFVESQKGKIVLQHKGYRYRKCYTSKIGTRWNCSLKKNCAAFIYLNDNDEILMTNEEHDHPQTNILDNKINGDKSDTAIVITSRKGKEMVLFRKYTYRKQYKKGNKSRWICSTLKNCRGYVFTDNNNCLISAFEEHYHDPPKYYLNADNIIKALREPLIIETD